MVNQLDFCSKTSFFIQKCPFSLFSTSISLYLFAKLYLLTFYPGQICNSTLCNNSNASSLTLLNNNLYVRPLPTRTAIIMDWSGRWAFKLALVAGRGEQRTIRRMHHRRPACPTATYSIVKFHDKLEFQFSTKIETK